MTAGSNANGSNGRTGGLNPEPARRVLDCVLLDPACWDKAQRLSLDDFLVDADRAVFDGMRTLAARKREITLADLLECVDREKLLLFSAAQDDFHPRTNPKEVDTWIEKAVRETAMRMLVHELDRIHGAASNGHINEADLIRLGEMGSKLQRTGKRKLVSFGIDDFLAHQFPPAEPFLILPSTGTVILKSSSIVQLFAWRGCGKTMVALGLAGALATGTDFLGWHSTRKVKVLFIDGEMPGDEMQQRVRQLAGQATPEFFRIIPFAGQDYGITPISTAEGRADIEEAIGDAEVLVLDSISTLGQFETNDEGAWLDVVHWLNRLRQRGLCIVFLHHAGKGGLSRGHSRSEDLLDRSIKLSRDDADEDITWLKCTLSFDKFRGLKNGVRSLIVEYKLGAWLWNEVQVEKLQLLEKYMDEHPGASSRRIAEEVPELGSYVSVQKLQKKLAEKKAKERADKQAAGDDDADDSKTGEMFA